MGSDWKEVSLGEIGRVVTGKTPKTKVIENFGHEIPFITPRDMDDQRIISETERYLSKVGSVSVKNSIIPANSISVSCIGSDMGKSAITKYLSVTNQQINSIVVSDEFYYKFVYYNLSSRKAEIRGLAGGSAQPILNKSDFSQIKMFVPPLTEQKAIAYILGSLDDKIELNRQMNETLEAMAQALFKSWFVDFDPVIDNALAAGNAIPEVFAKRAEQRKSIDKKDNTDIQSLFPDTFEFTEEMGWIPKGWSIQSFSELAILDTTSVKPNTKSEKLWEHFSIPAFDIDMSPVFDIGEDIKSNKYKVNANAVLVSKLNPETERIWWVNVQDEESAICSTEFMQFIPVNYKHRAFIYSLVRSDYFQTEILSRVTGSTGSRQRAQPKSVAIIDILKPEENLLIKYSNIAFNWKKKVSVNIDQNLKLAKLRETLLPKLMSGELRIVDTAALVENI